MIYYDDNFGVYDIESEEDIEFYHQMQKMSVEKICVDCGKTVRIKYDYEVCNSCAERREQGFGN